MRARSVVLVVLLLSAAPAGAQTSSDELEQAREHRSWAQAELEAISHDFNALAARYAKVQAQADLSAARLMDALLIHSDLQAAAARARALLDGRADAIYRAGPAAFVDVLLGSSSPGGMLASQEIVERALAEGIEDSVAAVKARNEAGHLLEDMEEARTELVRHQAHLAEIRSVMEIRLTEAESRLETADRRVAELERQRRELTAAITLEDRYLDLIEVDGELSELLEMLGPSGGAGCEIPPALEPTGEVFAGEASFYGEEFAGNPTAIGHVFNPALFTAAHRTLPLPSFLHVRYGGRCATVLVNDRGPYVDGRILDLSEGAARYLGLPGVGEVVCEILKPA